MAHAADVGVATVSRVINESSLVSAPARERVLQAIAQLGYRPSSTARSLSLGRAQTIGVVAPFFTSSSVLERLRGVVERLSQGEYDLMLFDVETLTQRADAFSSFARGDRVDGLLIISLRPSAAELAALAQEELPVVLVDVRHPRLSSVHIDDLAGGELAAEHLLARGHRRIGFVGDAPTPLGFNSSELRRQGMRRSLQRAGIKPVSALEMRGPHGRVPARGLAQRLLRAPEPPTAIFAASDIQAAGVLEAARALNRHVPDDLAVIGFDDIELSGLLELTTIRQPLRWTGSHGADLLLAAIRDPAVAPVQELMPLTVVQRRTT